MNRIAHAMLALALGTTVSGAGALAQDAQHENHGTHESGVAAAPAVAATPAVSAPASGPVLYLPEDLHFLHHMMVHHQQAVDMGALMEGRTERAELVRFAGYIADAQRVEMRTMQGMLDMAAARGLSATAHMPHGDPPMAGMLSSAEMAALEAASGAEFERLWLEGMIFHHEGGLAMARAQELQQALHRRQPYGIAVMLDEILVTQRAEITQMRGWLEEWGMAQDGDRRPPAADIISPVEGAAIPAGQPMAVFGAAVDDTGVSAVRVAIRNLDTGEWLRGDGAWGERELLPAVLTGSGPAGAAWRFDFTPPAASRYAVEAEAEDAAGNRAPSPAPRMFEAAP
jgi:uncharacterized protein (DUF305 family)